MVLLIQQQSIENMWLWSFVEKCYSLSTNHELAAWHPPTLGNDCAGVLVCALTFEIVVALILNCSERTVRCVDWAYVHLLLKSPLLFFFILFYSYFHLW